MAEQTGSPALGGLRHSCTFRKGFPAVACLFTRLCSCLNLLSPLPLHFPLHHVGLTSPFNFFFNFKIFFFMQPRGPFLKSWLALFQYRFGFLLIGHEACGVFAPDTACVGGEVPSEVWRWSLGVLHVPCWAWGFLPSRWGCFSPRVVVISLGLGGLACQPGDRPCADPT